MTSQNKINTILLASVSLLYSTPSIAQDGGPDHTQHMIESYITDSQGPSSGINISFMLIIFALIFAAFFISIIIRLSRKSSNTNPDIQYNIRQNTTRKKYTPAPRAPKPRQTNTNDFDTQLRKLHKLHEDNILSSTEYQTQKQAILDKLAQQ